MGDLAVIQEDKKSKANSNQKNFKQIITTLEGILRGKEKVIEYSLAALLARGHLLFEDMPGTGKTSLARGFAQVFGGKFNRIQMTSDLLPSDVVGHLRMNPKSRDLEFRKGPVFSNFLLADELNRTSPKTQGALLESMEEKTVTIDGTSYPLPDPFFVLATQNPLESFGVYPLPESQLDRFMMLITIGFPGQKEEKQIYLHQNLSFPSVDQLFDLEQMLSWQGEVDEVFVEDTVVAYATKIVRESRELPELRSGISVRGGLQIIACSKSLAFIRGRNFVTPNDIKELSPYVLAHRLSLNSGSQSLEDKKEVLLEFIENIPEPK